MPSTKYPDLTIKDDWNDRTPPPVTSLGDDILKSKNEPQLGLFHSTETGEFVETSQGAVPTKSETANAARSVAMKNPETVGSYALAGASGTEPGDSGATMPTATTSVEREPVDGDDDEDDDEPAGDQATPFDPSEKSVTEVNTYLAGDITEDERKRVLDAERAGKNRSTVNGL